jgi:limonene-1,2-epoxide hydrolase
LTICIEDVNIKIGGKMIKHVYYTVIILIISFLFGCNEIESSKRSDNIKIVKQFFEEGHNNRNLNIADKIISDSFEKFNNGKKTKGRGPQVLKDAINMHINNNREFRFNIGEIICDDDKVVVKWRWEAINTKFGKPVEVTSEGISVFYIKNNRIEKLWQIFDLYDFYTALGYKISPPEK